MAAADLPAVTALSDGVHGAYAESTDVYAERLRLYPTGCHVLAGGAGDISGYLVSHPWDDGPPPVLNAVMGALPRPAILYYLHDIALSPNVRGRGAGAAGLALATDAARAAGFDRVALVAVAGADAVWAAFGFAYDGRDDDLAAAGYGVEARHMTLRL